MLKFHHIGVAVMRIEEMQSLYQNVFAGSVSSEKVLVSSQGVCVSFLDVGNNVRFEFVSKASDAPNAVGAFLNRNSPYYHVAFTASEFNEDVKHLEYCGLKPLETFKSEAFEMKRCAFFIGPDHHIIEIIEE